MNKRKGCLWLLLAMMLTAISPLAYASERQLINSVSVQVSLPKGLELHPKIEERVRESIGKAASAVLVGQEVSVMRQTQGEISQLVKTVFNLVIRGYRILDIKMIVGTKTVILLELQPTSILIEQVALNLQLHDLDDKIVQVVDQEVREVNRQVEELMIGLPVEALTWADDVIESVLYGLIEWKLPGFIPRINLTIGPEIILDLDLWPQGEIVEDIRVDITTRSLPRLLVPTLEQRVEKEMQMFYGLPVQFLQKYQDRIIDAIERALHEERWSKHVYLNNKPRVELGSTTHLALDVDWIDYQVDFVSELNFGLDAPGPALRLSLGKRFTPWLILKLQDEITLSHLTGTVSASVETDLGAGFGTKVEYHLREANWTATVDWRREQYGITVSQSFPDTFPAFRLSLNYYPLITSQVSLVYEKQRLWVSWRQTL